MMLVLACVRQREREVIEARRVSLEAHLGVFNAEMELSYQRNIATHKAKRAEELFHTAKAQWEVGYGQEAWARR
jgi:hypothetical protein